jgi:hypothetical protein
MSFSRNTLMAAAALMALGACASTASQDSSGQAMAAVSGKSALDTAIEAAGGEAALSKVQEVFFTGAAKVTADGKVAEESAAILVRPFDFLRVTTWAKGKEEKTSNTVQAEQGKAWDVNRVTWIPKEPAGAKFQNEQLGLYSLMLLTPLKADGATVTDQPAAADGTRTVKVTHPKAQPVDLTIDASGKLVQASYSGTDPKTGAAISEVYKFSGEIASNGVKWPKTIKVERNGAAAYEIELASFEALPTKTVRPLLQAMQYETGGPPSGDDAG